MILIIILIISSLSLSLSLIHAVQVHKKSLLEIKDQGIDIEVKDKTDSKPIKISAKPKKEKITKLTKNK